MSIRDLMPVAAAKGEKVNDKLFSFHLSMSTTTGTSDTKVLGVVLFARHADREGPFYYTTYISKGPSLHLKMPLIIRPQALR